MDRYESLMNDCWLEASAKGAVRCWEGWTKWRPSVICKDAEMDERKEVRLQWEWEIIREARMMRWMLAGFDERGRQSDKLRLMSNGKLLQCWISTWADCWLERQYGLERGDAETESEGILGFSKRGRVGDHQKRWQAETDDQQEATWHCSYLFPNKNPALTDWFPTNVPSTSLGLSMLAHLQTYVHLYTSNVVITWRLAYLAQRWFLSHSRNGFHSSSPPNDYHPASN